MRRRIDRDLNDCTERPYLYLDEFDGRVYLQPPPSALYDEALWAEVIEARQRLRAAEERLVAALVPEPLDAKEIELGRAQGRMCDDRDPYDTSEWDRIRAELRAHAATVERKP